jgi:DNA-directed RNA polymerase subunit M/transcription elongation factor TFIIS
VPSLTQRIVLRLMPGRREQIERESREWLVTCGKCGHSRSIWDMGGIRYKAKSRGKSTYVKCERCGERSMQPVEHRPGVSSPE